MLNVEPTGHDAADADGLAHLNTLPAGDFVRLILETCHLPVGSWAERLESARPFADPDSLVATAQTLVARLTDAEVVAAHAGLTRLGERRPPTTDRQARWSRIESAGIPQEEAVLARFAQANRAYEKRFGHVFLISAAGLDAEEMLAAMERRLSNDRTTENAAIRGELATLVGLRLTRLLGELGESPAAPSGNQPAATAR